MSLGYSDYQLFTRTRIEPLNLARDLVGYDRFLSAFNTSDRVTKVFDLVSATVKHWILFDEYGLTSTELPVGTIGFTPGEVDEAEAVQTYFDRYPLNPSERICIDITGFIRPHLLFILRFLYESGIDRFDLIYSEPDGYKKGSATQFASDVKEVRLVMGYEGSHSPDIDGEFLLVGCSYDSQLMSVVANNYLQAKKVQLFPFPPLRPHMYQENRLRTEESKSAFEKVLGVYFAPSYDPFATAKTLSEFYSEYRPLIKNLYLAPLATKPQVVGFALFYLMECLSEPISIAFPFSRRYNQETSFGLSETWRYEIDCALMRSITA